MRIFATYTPVKYTKNSGKELIPEKAEEVEILRVDPLQVIFITKDKRLESAPLERFTNVSRNTGRVRRHKKDCLQ